MSDQHWLARRRRCYGSTPIHRLDQQRQLRWRQAHRAVDDRRPYEAALLQPLGEEAEPRAIPVQRLQVVAALAAKQEELTAERIGPDHLLHLRRQPVKAVAQIDRAAGEEDLGARRQADHTAPFIACSTQRSAFSLTLPSTRMRAPLGRAISITPRLSALPRSRHTGCSSAAASDGSPHPARPIMPS